MIHKHDDVLLGAYDDRTEAEYILHKEAAKLRLWKVQRRYRVFLEKTAPHLPDSPWGVWLRTVKENMT